MKKLFFAIAVMLQFFTLSAQSPLIATLSHEGNITTFYGASALKSAYEAAVDGDIINLSAGTFNAVNIEKGITIRGAGMGSWDNSETIPTTINGEFIIQNTSSPIIIEGISHSDHYLYYTGPLNVQFIKDRFYKISPKDTNEKSSFSFVNCKIDEFVDNSALDDFNFQNSIIVYPCRGNFYNCMLLFMKSSHYYDYDNVEGSTFVNCIINLKNKSYRDPYLKHCVAYNCLATGSNMGETFSNQNNFTNRISDGYSVYKTFNQNYPDVSTFELTDEAAATYLGTDGTQVGIYGGALPFDPTPTNPQITKFNVSPRSDVNGKLSVDIEIEMPQ